MNMTEFWDYLGELLANLWNALYDLICGELDEEVNEDFYVDTLFPNIPE